MTTKSTTPPWAAKLVLAMRDYERAKAAVEAAVVARDAVEARLDTISLEQAHWKSEQMACAAAALRANGEDGV